jgi:hypothetical protein
MWCSPTGLQSACSGYGIATPDCETFDHHIYRASDENNRASYENIRAATRSIWACTIPSVFRRLHRTYNRSSTSCGRVIASEGTIRPASNAPPRLQLSNISAEASTLSAQRLGTTNPPGYWPASLPERFVVDPPGCWPASLPQCFVVDPPGCPPLYVSASLSARLAARPSTRVLRCRPAWLLARFSTTGIFKCCDTLTP